MTQTDLNTLITRHLLGQCTAEEEAALSAWRQADARHDAHLRALEQRTDLTAYYDRYHAIDVEEARRSLKVGASHHRFIGFTRRPLLIAASVAAVLVLATVLLFRQAAPAPVVATAVPAPVEEAIAEAKASPVSAATITINGTPVAVSTDSAAQAVGQGSASLLAKLGLEDAPEATVTTVHGREFWLTLSDGTRVHLDYSSQLTYPVQFTGRIRDVTLVGRACFYVAHNAEKRFVVHTPQGTITDLGTTFAVDTRSAGRTVVTLVSGAVTVNTGADGSTATTQTLKPGEQAMMQSGRIPAVSPADLSLLEAWNTGRYSFDGVTLGKLMEVVGEWYGLEPTFTIDSLRGLRFSGQLSRYGDAQATLQAIGIVTGARIVTEGHRIVVSK